MDLVFRIRVEANGAALTTTAIILVITPAMSGFMVRTRLVGLVAALIIIIPRALIATRTVMGRMFGNAGLVLLVPSPITRASLVIAKKKKKKKKPRIFCFIVGEREHPRGT